MSLLRQSVSFKPAVQPAVNPIRRRKLIAAGILIRERTFPDQQSLIRQLFFVNPDGFAAVQRIKLNPKQSKARSSEQEIFTTEGAKTTEEQK